MGNKKILNIFDFFRIINDEEKLLKFLRENLLLKDHPQICECDGKMDLKPNKKEREDKYRWRCTRRLNKKNCGKEFSIRKNSFFEDSKLPLKEILAFVYLWTQGTSHTTFCTIFGRQAETITSLVHKCNDVCSAVVEKWNPDEYQIGGFGSVVEIDESLFGETAKYHKGKYYQQWWFFWRNREK